MVNLSVQISDDIPATIIRKHINEKALALVNWYSTLNKPSKYLPDDCSDKEAEEVIKSLMELFESEDIIELKDKNMKFALSCILEEEEMVIDMDKELSAEFCDQDRKALKKYLPNEDISYYESYDHFRDLLLPEGIYE